MGLPTADQLGAAPLTIVVFGPGFGESLVLRAQSGDKAVWAVIDAALVEQAAPGATIACVEPLLEPPSPYAVSEDPDDAAAVRRSQTKMAHLAIKRAWRTGSPKWPLVQASQHDFAGWRITVLHPDADTLKEALSQYASGIDVNLNDISASLLVERDGLAFVLGADGEQAAWTAIAARLAPEDLRHTRPVKVPHHGSRDAIRPVLIDPDQPDVGRPQVVTPFPNSGTLPRFDPDHGVELLLRAGGEVELTAMPVDLVPTAAAVTLIEAREALLADDFEGDEEIPIQLTSPVTGSASLMPGRRDPYESWVLLAIHADGDIEVLRGAHAIHFVQ
jgi:hypothetical protein